MLVEMYLGKLPWAGKSPNDKVYIGKLKEQYNKMDIWDDISLPLSLIKFKRYLNTLTYYDMPDYDMLYNLLHLEYIRKYDNINQLYDWQIVNATTELLTTDTNEIVNDNEPSIDNNSLILYTNDEENRQVLKQVLKQEQEQEEEKIEQKHEILLSKSIAKIQPQKPQKPVNKSFLSFKRRYKKSKK